MRYKLITSLFLSLIFGNGFAQEPEKKVPDFNFSRQNEAVFTNKDLAKDKLLFFVFFDVSCDHCQHAITYINEHSKEFEKAAIYLITLDSEEKVTVFMNQYAKNLKNNRNVTLLQDNRQEFINKFKPRKYPSMFLYSKKKELIMYDDNEQNLFMFLKKIKTSRG